MPPKNTSRIPYLFSNPISVLFFAAITYISSAFEKRYEELIKEGDGFENDRDAYAEEIFSLFQKKLGGSQLHLLHIHLKLDSLLIMQ